MPHLRQAQWGDILKCTLHSGKNKGNQWNFTTFLNIVWGDFSKHTQKYQKIHIFSPRWYEKIAISLPQSVPNLALEPQNKYKFISINSFILLYNLLSQHKRFGRWSIGEQKDLHQNGISAKVGRVATELRRSNIVEASYNSRFLTLALRLHASFSHPGITPLHHLKIPHFADESITSQRLKPKLSR